MEVALEQHFASAYGDFMQLKVNMKVSFTRTMFCDGEFSLLQGSKCGHYTHSDQQRSQTALGHPGRSVQHIHDNRGSGKGRSTDCHLGIVLSGVLPPVKQSNVCTGFLRHMLSQ